MFSFGWISLLRKAIPEAGLTTQHGLGSTRNPAAVLREGLPLLLATSPLPLGLLHTLGLEAQLIFYLVVATFAGFTGVMISPIHI